MSSTTTWPARRASTSPTAAATRAAMRWSAPAPAERCAAGAGWQAAFGRAYREKFGRAPRQVALEFINARVSLRVAVPGGKIADLEGGGRLDDAVKGVRRAWFAEERGFADATVYDRTR